MRMEKAEATKFFSILLRGEHHLPHSGLRAFGEGWAINYVGDLASFDGNLLTRLVFLAHDYCMRVSIVQGGPRAAKIVVWKREGRDGDLCRRHPGLEDAFRSWRKEGWGTIEDATDKEPFLL